MVNSNTSKCPGCGNPIEIEKERRLYTCSNCSAESYLVAGDADLILLSPSASIIGREGLAVLAEREKELSWELHVRRDRLERMRDERAGNGRKRRLTRRLLTANMVIIGASALILYLDPNVDTSQLAAAGILMVLTIMTLTFLFLHNSISRSAAYRMEFLENEERKARRELNQWRQKIDAALRIAVSGGIDSREKETADDG